ncbi:MULTISPECIES: hypothetical protein [Thermodesulfovibrio]|jgi:cytochrome b subunit of formate dehydrogenase|uniref:Uncharacterized protein n=1 Tax=Thermodesulfovibrio yellowstonii (strain ATCC 51303 / DSM 11347 / YP87) TaxID=289376 RepID=B5YIP0_THEYD|nr:MULTISPECIES: hypothetical protein [Thermodesulfovibrio]ACI20242.1 conserved hypothetical protein [Thermodesulfovibrio yellowstonii DSM 11347]
MKKLLIIILSIFILGTSVSFAKEIPFTQEDRERLIRVEEGLKAVNQRIDSLDKRIDDLKNLMYILISVIFAQTIGVVGFVIWDRRTALQPAIRKNKELEERQDRVEKALRELAKVDSRIAEILKNAGLL